MSSLPDTASRRGLLAVVRNAFGEEQHTAAAIEPTHAPQPDAERVLMRLEWQVVRRLDGLLQGDYRSLFTGQGLDLAEIREYQAGDDVRAMDWNVTARTGVAHVRQYHEDREITAWLLLDTSASVEFGTARRRKSDLLLDFAGSIARLLGQRGNRVGAMFYSREIDSVLPPRAGRQQVLALIHSLIRPDAAPAAGMTDLAAVLNQAAGSIRRRSLVFVVSDFIAGSGWEPALRRLSQRHEVVAVWLRDPREESLPDIGPLVLEDAETGEQLYIDTHDRGFRTRFEAQTRERQERLVRTFGGLGVDLLSLSTDGEMLGSLAQFALRRRQGRGRSAARAAVAAI